MDLNPVILTYYPLKYKDYDFLMRHREEIEWLLGVQLSKSNPEKAYRVYREKMVKIARMVSEKCTREKEGKTCIYKYIENLTREFLKTPVLSAMRGTVIRWYDNGEAVRLAFPFAKFFNLHEVPMTEKLPEAGAVIYEKLDGTLVSCWLDTDGEIRCSTRGLLDNMRAEVGKTSTLVVRGENPVVKVFMSSINKRVLEDLVGEDVTVMFELIGDKPGSQCPIVERCLSSPKPFLLAKRKGESGIEYIVHEAIPSPRRFNYKPGELEGVARRIKDFEGFVIHYPGLKYHPGVDWWDYLVKVKSPLYIVKSEVLWAGKGSISYKRLARYVIVSGNPDDLASVFPEERDFILDVWEKWVALREEYEALLESASDKTVRVLKSQKYKWLAELLEESHKRGVAPLKRFIIFGLPRSKAGIPSYLDRIKTRIREARRLVA